MIRLADCRRVLAFYAHPDDETLAAGATLAKLSGLGAEVHVAIPATGIHSRRNLQSDSQDRELLLGELRKDCARAMTAIKVDPKRLYLGEFADNEMDKHTLLELIHWLEALIEKVNPDVVFTHHQFCTNIDHQYCHNAAVVATRPSTGAHVALISGEVPSSTGYLRPAAWEPNFYVEISEANLEAKIESMQSYRNEARPDPHPRSPEVLRALAKVRGSEAGFTLAESFMIQRVFA